MIFKKLTAKDIIWDNYYDTTLHGYLRNLEEGLASYTYVDEKVSRSNGYIENVMVRVNKLECIVNRLCDLMEVTPVEFYDESFKIRLLPNEDIEYEENND